MPSFSKALLALVLITSAAATPIPQLAGEGAASDSIISNIDNGVGYGVEDAEDKIAANIDSLKSGGGLGNLGSSTGGATGGSSGPPPPPPPPGGPHRRQLDKISNGFQAISQAAGSGAETQGLTNQLDNVDGESTSDAANAGAQIGNAETSILTKIGSSVPKV
jgi:hypothetical protein